MPELTPMEANKKRTDFTPPVLVSRQLTETQ